MAVQYHTFRICILCTSHLQPYHTVPYQRIILQFNFWSVPYQRTLPVPLQKRRTVGYFLAKIEAHLPYLRTVLPSLLLTTIHTFNVSFSCLLLLLTKSRRNVQKVWDFSFKQRTNVPYHDKKDVPYHHKKHAPYQRTVPHRKNWGVPYRTNIPYSHLWSLYCIILSQCHHLRLHMLSFMYITFSVSQFILSKFGAGMLIKCCILPSSSSYLFIYQVMSYHKKKLQLPLGPSRNIKLPLDPSRNIKSA